MTETSDRAVREPGVAAEPTLEQVGDALARHVGAAGWDPEPFVAVVRAGLLDSLLRLPDGSPRRVRGELAGGWLSDQFALAEDAEVLRAVRRLVEEDRATT